MTDNLDTDRKLDVATAKPDPSAQRKPSLSIKPSPMTAASPSAGSPGTASSLLSKEWVVPPRPKPGRKPATDTPPTKRKAQNRAAQRAFRERRAARVGELEEQMKQMEAEDEAEQMKLRENIDKLEKDVEQYRDELIKSIERCRGLENELAAVNSGQNSHTGTSDAVPLPKRTSTREAQPTDDDTTVGCGNCSAETNCQCLDEAFDVLSAAAQRSVNITHEKRPHSPSTTPHEKRVKVEPQEGQEIDFTAMFASRPRRDTTTSNVVEVLSPHSAADPDPCGFCSDGTPCICAQMAAEQHEHEYQAETAVNMNIPGSASAVNHLSQFTPPPSEGDCSTSSATTTQHQAPPLSNPCASGPGTCAQCRADPNSTLFCKSLAASRSQSQSQSNSTSQDCCGASGAGSCCQDQIQDKSKPRPSARATRSKKLPSINHLLQPDSSTDSTAPKPSHITLSCADAYTTLSRHPAYERASGEIANWMPQLRANDVGEGKGKMLEGRPAMEIDAANVMTVLKGFDRRFGVGGGGS